MQNIIYANEDFACIASFIHYFNEYFKFVNITITLLKDWLTNEISINEEFKHLLYLLMKRCEPNSKKIQLNDLLIKFSRSYSLDDSIYIKKFGFAKSPFELKTRLLKNLFEAQFDWNKSFQKFVNSKDENYLRFQEIGYDNEGSKYWFILDNNCNFLIYCDFLLNSSLKLLACKRSELSSLLIELKEKSFTWKLDELKEAEATSAYVIDLIIDKCIESDGFSRKKLPELSNSDQIISKPTTTDNLIDYDKIKLLSYDKLRNAELPEAECKSNNTDGVLDKNYYSNTFTQFESSDEDCHLQLLNCQDPILSNFNLFEDQCKDFILPLDHVNNGVTSAAETDDAAVLSSLFNDATIILNGFKFSAYRLNLPVVDFDLPDSIIDSKINSESPKIVWRDDFDEMSDVESDKDDQEDNWSKLEFPMTNHHLHPLLMMKNIKCARKRFLSETSGSSDSDFCPVPKINKTISKFHRKKKKVPTATLR